MSKKPITSIDITQTILELTHASWIDADEFKKIPEMLNIPPGEVKVDFCQNLVAIIKRMPETLIDDENREKILEAAQEFLDKVIEEEEELLDEQGE